MPIIELNCGPPGTGKTTHLLGQVDRALDAGVPANLIAYVTFGKKATEDVQTRIGVGRDLGDDEFYWVRTIHSTAYRLNPDKRTLMDGTLWRDFGRRYGYKLTLGRVDLDQGNTAHPVRTADDKLRAVYDWGRSRRLSMAETLAASKLRVSPQALQRFVDRYENFKRNEAVIDFIDLIAIAIRRGLRAPVQIAFVDEVQDLSPLEQEFVNVAFQYCQRIVLAGDDDQTIYGFKGADPAWMVKLSQNCRTTVLGQSYRVPRNVHALTQAIINRNVNRIEKHYLPRGAAGTIEQMPLLEALRSIDAKQSTFLLARNRYLLDDPAKELRRRGVPFVIEGARRDANPLDPDVGLAGALRTALRIGRRETIKVRHLVTLLRFVPTASHLGLAPRGLVGELQKQRPDDVLCHDDVVQLLGSGQLLQAMATEGPAATLKNARREDLAYVERVFERYGEEARANVVLTTMHASKGRQADAVIVLPEMAEATYEESLDTRRGGYEAENRVFYVAATRTRERLVLVHPQSAQTFRFPRLAT